jgi:O-antigen ligase
MSYKNIIPSFNTLKINLESLPAFFMLGFCLCIPFSSPLSSVFAVLLLVFYILSGDYSQKWQAYKSSNIAIFCTLLFCWTLITASFSEAEPSFLYQDLFKYKKLLLCIPFLYYLKPQLKRDLIIAYVAGVFIVIGLSLFKGHGFIHLLQTGEFQYTTSFRIYITEGMHIALALFALLFFFKTQPTFRKKLIAPILIILIHALFMNGRMGLISLIVVALYFSFLLFETAYLKLYFFVFLLITSISIYQFSPLVQSRALRTIDEASQIFNPAPVTSIRLQYFQLSTQLFLKHPIIGNGPGSFKTANNLRGIDSDLKTHLHTHNEYLTLLSQYGLIGFSLFSLIIFFSIRALHTDQLNRYREVVFIGLALFLLNCLTDSMVYMEAYFLVFLIGLCQAVSES